MSAASGPSIAASTPSAVSGIPLSLRTFLMSSMTPPSRHHALECRLCSQRRLIERGRASEPARILVAVRRRCAGLGGGRGGDTSPSTEHRRILSSQRHLHPSILLNQLCNYRAVLHRSGTNLQKNEPSHPSRLLPRYCSTCGSGYEEVCFSHGGSVRDLGGSPGGGHPCGAAAARSSRIDFERQIQPILAKHCLECHSQDKRKGGLSLATYERHAGRRAAAGPSSARQQRGKPDLDRLTGAVEPQMPKDELPLARRRSRSSGCGSIRARARRRRRRPAPRAVGSAAGARRGRRCRRSAGRAGRAARSLRRRVPRAARRAAAARSCPTRTFARRAYLDVWGLLPTPEELQAFVADRGARQARRAGRDAARRQRASTPITGSRSGTICSATRTASHTSRRPTGARASPTGCCRR